MSKNITGMMSETIGATLGTGFGIAITGYGIFTLITDSLAVLF